MEPDIGRRVLQRLEEDPVGRTQREVAERIGMTPDALSRALNGKRAFSSIELARVADVLNADIHWLITGEPDPNRLVVAARHDFDHQSGRRDVPGRDADRAVINDIALAYRQGFPNAVAAEGAGLPQNPSEARQVLGADFVRPFIERVEQRLGVDVVRVAELSTAYSFTLAHGPVVAVPATGNWFRENWSLAHELGHLALVHHDESLGEAEWERLEAGANAYAAELLLPGDEIRAIDWQRVSARDLATRIWDLGVSTDALARRVRSLGLALGEALEHWGSQPTQRLLRQHLQAHLGADPFADPITERMHAASGRRFPRSVQNAHLELIASGDLAKGTLAWMLGITPDGLEVDAPTAEGALDTDALADALGLGS